MTAPVDSASPAEAASVAAEALRTVKHLTLGPPAPGTPGWEDIGDLCRVVGELRVMVERLPQTLRQVARHLERPALTAACRTDAGTGQKPSALLAETAARLSCGAECSRMLREHLDAAQTAMAHLVPIGLGRSAVER